MGVLLGSGAVEATGVTSCFGATDGGRRTEVLAGRDQTFGEALDPVAPGERGQPAVRDSRDPIERARELAGDSAHRVAVVSKVDGQHKCVLEAGRVVDGPEGGFEG